MTDHETRLGRSFFGLTPTVPMRLVVLFCFVTLLYWASQYLYVPFLPIHAESLGASLGMIGIVVASFGIAQVLLRLPFGIWAGSLGRHKPFVIFGFIAAGLGAVLMALAPNSWTLFWGRSITGASAAAWVAFTIFFAGYFPRHQAIHAMGIISAMNGAAVEPRW